MALRPCNRIGSRPEAGPKPNSQPEPQFL